MFNKYLNSIKFIFQKNTPLGLQTLINFYFASPLNKKRRKAVFDLYKAGKLNVPNNEITAEIEFLKGNCFATFPYKWALKYKKHFPEIYVDAENQFHYILFENKKLYFPKKFSQKQIIWTVRNILKEQDIQSPHQYLDENFQVDEQSILIDAGVAEGSFSLSAIEKVKKLYLIECDIDWLEALTLTFAPWKEKVEIVGKYLSDSLNDSTISIDSLITVEKKEKYFIKYDIEGFEIQALKGMNIFFKQVENLKMSVCTYHRVNDANDIYKGLSSKGLNCTFSDGYMLLVDENEVPTFRKAMVRAKK